MDISSGGDAGEPSDIGLSLPAKNAEVLSNLFLLEVALRELVIEELQRTAGAAWVRQRLPKDVRGKMNKGRAAERSQPWQRQVDHHPIYYTDFPDLGKLIEQNWKTCFQDLFRKKLVLRRMVDDVQLARNQAAHNRTCTSEDVRCSALALRALSQTIGESRFRELVSRRTQELSLPDKLRSLTAEIRNADMAMSALEPYPDTPILRSVSLVVVSQSDSRLASSRDVTAAWWFDEDYLGVALDGVTEFVRMAVGYVELPHKRGSGPELDKWKRRAYDPELAKKALAALAEIPGVEV